jgi:GT2 family glycosyltransferase
LNAEANCVKRLSERCRAPTAGENVDVSVVVVNWNTRDLLAQALDSLHRETIGISFETVVVDNGSEDGSAQMVRAQWPGVHLIEQPDNRGFAGANNAGFRMARGRYVLLLNSDTIVLPTTVPGLVAVLDADDRIGCVGARHLNLDGSLQRSIDNPPSLLNDFLFFALNDVVNALGLTRFGPVSRWLRLHSLWWGDHDTLQQAGWVNGACMLVRHSVIDQVGPLDETFFLYGDEVDWCYRMRSAGWLVVFTPSAEVIHIGGQSTRPLAGHRVFLKYLAMLRFYKKNLPTKTPRFLAMIRVLAAARIGMIVALGLLEQLGVRRSEKTWSLVTQEAVRTPYRTILSAWLKVLRLE